MKKIIFLIILAVSLYLPSLGIFFSGDDFFHLRISQTNSFQDFISFFSFEKNVHSASFYRPLTTQVFFWLGQQFFGLKPFGYHLLSLIVYGGILYLVYLLAKKLLEEEKIALLTLFFYAFSVSHFTQIYYLSAFQELGMTLFYFAGLLTWFKFLETEKKRYLFLTLFLFVFSLLSKETAITFPLMVGILMFSQKKQKQLIFLMPFFLIELAYFYLRLTRFGLVGGDSYLWEISWRVFNTFAWYVVWALGIPEMFLDFIGPKLAVSPKLFLFYPWPTKIIFVSFSIFFLTSLFAFFKKIKNNVVFYIVCFLWFIISLLPVLFLPWHKFPLELTLPLLGAALFLGIIFARTSRFLLFLGLISFLVLNLTSYYLTYQTHWVTRRGRVAKRVIDYFTKEYPLSLSGKNIYFYNNSAVITKDWGASKHIWITLSGSDALQVFYKNQNIKVFYEDIDGKKEDPDMIRLGTKDFLGY